MDSNFYNYQSKHYFNLNYLSKEIYIAINIRDSKKINFQKVKIFMRNSIMDSSVNIVGFTMNFEDIVGIMMNIEVNSANI